MILPHLPLPLLSSTLCTSSGFSRLINNSYPHRNRCPSFPISFLKKAKHGVILGLCRDSLNSEQIQTTDERGRHEEESFQVVSAIRSTYNDIVIIDTEDSRLLLLDETHNVHSIFYKGKNGYWTDSYWDEFAALPPIVPPGPIAIYGLGGGTAAHLLLHSYPHLEIEGWEIDGVLVDKARDYLGLTELEMVNSEGGVLKICIGDVLTESTGTKYAGIVVDLFCGGKVLEQMESEEFWVEMKRRLQPGGRLMVNTGGAENADGEDWAMNATVRAMGEVFNGKMCWKKMPKSEGANYMALSGAMPDLEAWEGSVPQKLQAKLSSWMPFPNAPI